MAENGVKERPMYKHDVQKILGAVILAPRHIHPTLEK